MRSRSKMIAPLLLGLVLIAGLVGGCEQDGANGQDAEPKKQETEKQGLENQLVVDWSQSKHAQVIAFAAEEEGCKNCHDGQTFTETGGGFQPRREAPSLGTSPSAGATPGAEATEAAEPRDWVVGTDCRVCHTAVGPEIAEEGSVDGIPNLPSAEGGTGALCMACHNGWHQAGVGREGNLAAPHYSVQTDMIYAVNTLRVSGDSTAGAGAGETSPSASGTGDSPEGVEGEPSPHRRVENTCVGCHMAGNGTGHTFKAENYEGCQGKDCHDQDMADGGEAKEDYDGDGDTEIFTAEVEGLMEQLESAINTAAGSSSFSSQRGDVAFVGGGRVNTDSAVYKAAYNYIFVEHDKSRGIHNPEFTVKLLKESIEGVSQD